MQQRSIIISAIVLAIAVSLGIIYLLAAPALNIDSEPTPTPTSTATPTPLIITPTPLITPQSTPTAEVNGAAVTAQTGTGSWVILITFLAVIFGSFNLIRQFKKA